MRLLYNKRMALLTKFIWGFGKYILMSMLVSFIGVIVSISLMTGKFPPTWKQIKGFRKTLETITSINKANGGANSMAFLQQQLQKMPLPAGGAGATGKAHAAQPTGYDDPEMADVKELMQHYQKQAALSQALTGDTFGGGGNLQLASEASRGQAQPQAPDPKLVERLRKLEDLVHSLHSQVYQLSQQLNKMQQAKTPSSRR